MASTSNVRTHEGPAFLNPEAAEVRIAERLDELRARRKRGKDEESRGFLELIKGLPLYEKAAVAAGIIAAGALLVNGQGVARKAVAVEGYLADAIGAIHEGPGTSARLDRLTYDGEFHIPSKKEPHRELTVGSEEGGHYLVNVVSVRDYIHQKNPEISLDEAADLIMAENSQDQIEAGVPKDKVDPILLLAGQAIRLPMEYGVGRIVKPEETSATHGG